MISGRLAIPVGDSDYKLLVVIADETCTLREQADKLQIVGHAEEWLFSQRVRISPAPHL